QSKAGPQAMGLLRRRQIDQRIDRALKDVGSGKGVDLLGTLGAADVGVNHCPFHRLRRPALVPQQDGELEWGEVARKGAGGLGARAVASIHVQWQADHEADDMLANDDGTKRSQVLRELRSTDRLERPREVPSGIANGDPDSLRPDVEPRELAVRDMECELSRFGGDQGRHWLNLRAASVRIACQNKA